MHVKLGNLLCANRRVVTGGNGHIVIMCCTAGSSTLAPVNVIQVSSAAREPLTSLLWAPSQEDKIASVTTSASFQVRASYCAALCKLTALDSCRAATAVLQLLLRSKHRQCTGAVLRKLTCAAMQWLRCLD
jgi:hypothetical protein